MSILPSPSLARRNRQSGFTLIEVIIVVGLSALLMIAASGVFLTLLVGRAKTANDQLLKHEGSTALSQMQFLIRNATRLLPITVGSSITCPGPTDPDTTLVLRSIDGGVTTFSQQVDSVDNKPKIASNSGIFLTSGNVDLVDGPHFQCSGNNYVTIDFTLRKNGTTQEFTSGVNMRNF